MTETSPYDEQLYAELLEELQFADADCDDIADDIVDE